MNTTMAYETEDERWTAVQARDAAADGHFVCAVRTTGVYGKPSSTARLPKRENVEFFDSAEAAEAAGYRSSRRARADQTSAAAERTALVARVCRLIEASETPPPLDDLATEVGMSPFHFHRLFKAETGLTPKAYSSAYRARKLREELSSADASITDAIYGAGFNSNSRFYEASEQLLGMRARDYRAGGAGAVIRFAVGQCSLGAIVVAQSQRGICAILLGTRRNARSPELGGHRHAARCRRLCRAARSAGHRCGAQPCATDHGVRLQPGPFGIQRSGARRVVLLRCRHAGAAGAVAHGLLPPPGGRRPSLGRNPGHRSPLSGGTGGLSAQQPEGRPDAGAIASEPAGP